MEIKSGTEGVVWILSGTVALTAEDHVEMSTETMIGKWVHLRKGIEIEDRVVRERVTGTEGPVEIETGAAVEIGIGTEPTVATETRIELRVEREIKTEDTVVKETEMGC